MKFNRQLSGFWELSLVNAHWHRDMAKKLDPDRRGLRHQAVDWLVARIRLYKVRFVLGDFNMSAYQICNDLRACGIEATLVAYHCELDKTCTSFLFDSCVIVAIGGLRFDPKVNTIAARCLTAAQVPYLKGEDRGYPPASYISTPGRAAKELSISSQVARDLTAQVTALRATACARSQCSACKKAPCPEHLYQLFNERVEADGSEARTSSNPCFRVTEGWDVLQDMKGMMARPCIWDPTGSQWNTCAHFPLNVVVGAHRGRSSGSKLHRSTQSKERWAEKKGKSKCAPAPEPALAARAGRVTLLPASPRASSYNSASTSDQSHDWHQQNWWSAGKWSKDSHRR